MAKSRVDVLLDALTKSGLEATRLSDEDSPCVVHSYISTGCTVLDAIMGGGIPCGRMVELYGDTSTGKSLIAAQACATIQEQGGLAVYVDTETAVSLPIMKAVGVDTQTLIYLAPDTVEDVFKAMESVVESKQEGEPILIVWDSIAATSARAEMEKGTGEHTSMAIHARLISKGLRKLTRTVSREEIACLFLNQAKEKIGVMYGDKVATFGGTAVGFHSSIRIMLKYSSKIQEGTKKSSRVLGVRVRARVTKNKVAPPFREAVLPIYFGHGIDDDGAMLLYLKDMGYLSSTGGGYYTITIDGKDIKFRKAAWSAVVDDNWDAISAMVLDAASAGDLI